MTVATERPLYARNNSLHVSQSLCEKLACMYNMHVYIVHVLLVLKAYNVQCLTLDFQVIVCTGSNFFHSQAFGKFTNA